ncbi:hypothetical protein T08_14623 [Trichinella sp. T8]|nr:hypothetical protein T08_14623 [Trichinella sp. T8]
MISQLEEEEMLVQRFVVSLSVERFVIKAPITSSVSTIENKENNNQQEGNITHAIVDGQLLITRLIFQIADR